MKKSLFYLLMTTATLLSPIFAFPSWAKDCPEIPKDTKVITVKSNKASLRIEAKQSSSKPNVSILKDDPLKVISFSPVKDLDSQDFCWYQVSAVKDTDNKPYFIADVGIKEFPFSNSSTGSNANASTTKNTSKDATSGQHSNSPPPPNNKGTSGQNAVAQEKLSQDVSQQKWLTFVVIGISIGNIIILLLVCVEVSKVRGYLNISGLYRPSIKPYEKGTAPIDIQIKNSVAEALNNLDVQIKDSVAQELERREITRTPIRLNRIQQDLGLPKQDGLQSTHEKLTTQERLLQKVVTQLTNFLEVLHRVEDTSQSNQDEIKFMTRRVESLEDNKHNTSSSGNQEISLNPGSDNNDSGQSDNQPEKAESHPIETSSSGGQEFVALPKDGQDFSPVTPSPITISPQLQEIIDRFNRQRPELFSDFPSQPLTLTQDTIDGKLGPSGRRILQLEVPADTSQDTYLRFEMDNASWLIPNITSRYISKIMRNLGENSDIFTIRGGSGSGSSLQLVKPAKLKVSTDNPGLWEIEEPGEFQQ